jgi:hypothetical protein
MESTKKIEKSEKAYTAIKGMKAEIKKLAAEQKGRRLEKLQKSLKTACALTVLHRLYLKIRNKPYEEVHRINDHNRWAVPSFTKQYYEKWDLGVIFLD